jgi:hypothetical protein
MVKVNKVNIESKSQLAKLFATENLSVEHNNVKTASFDLENRIVTLPIFKKPSGDVYDMLTAHECSHALHTPLKAWSKLEDPKYRAYVNVIEDTRIDKLIQKKYPGIVRNYVNAFEILTKDNFFGLKDKNINTDLMLIDKINMYYKSSKKLQFKFTKEEQSWVDKIDNIKTFTDVLKIAKQLYGYQEKQLEQLSKLPDFDNHPLAKNYKLDKNGKKIQVQNSEKDNGNNFESSLPEPKDSENKDSKESNVGNPYGAGGDNVSVDTALDCITDKSFEQSVDKLLDKTKTYRYATIPEPNLKNALVSYDEFLKDMRDNNNNHFKKPLNDSTSNHEQYIKYWNWIKQDFLKFKKDSTKTVMYLVKEFEMKKAATAYKRATTDKTGVIDSLKLKNYKFSDDIFKRLTVLPNSKNHGMIMLLDWSGSMCDIMNKTVHQLCNLVWFCQKINIPFEVYLFKDVQNKKEDTKEYFKLKNGNMFAEKSQLVNVASHRMKKTILHESLLHLYSMANYFNRNYSYSYDNIAEKGYAIPVDQNYHLTSTPLNEAIIMCNKLIPLFQAKYKVEKLSFITLTDGESNSEISSYTVDNSKAYNKSTGGRYDAQTIIKDGKKTYTTPTSYEGRHYNSSRTAFTSSLLKILQSKYNVTTIGFYLTKRVNKNSFSQFIDEYNYKDGKYQGLNPNFEKLRKQFLKDKVLEISKDGYNSYYVVNAKDMNIENTDLSTLNSGNTTSEIKRIFTKSMKNRLYSRVLLNKFIEQIV